MNILYSLLKKKYRASFAAYREAPDQTALLLEILRRNESSAYGRRYGFSDIHTIEQYQEQVPIVCYDDLRDFIDRIRLGQRAVLTSEDVLLFEPTGGSSGGHQWIPYTQTLKEQFRRSIEAWLYDIYHSYPKLAGGKAYWMITPPFEPVDQPPSTIPVGFETDEEYLGSLGKILMHRMMIQPQLHAGMTTEAFYQVTLQALLSERDLRVISVWNPSLLLGLTDYLAHNPERLLNSLSAKRRQEIRRFVYRCDCRGIWPNLGLISCWADGQAVDDAQEVARRFPGVTLQPKGLLSTESIVSFPTKDSLARGGMLPAYASTFLEFRLGSEVLTLDQLEEGAVYESIVTTGGGLYRYTSGDLVRVSGRLEGIPLLRFDGRSGTVDLVGEKLSHRFIEEIFSHHPGFYLVTPQGHGYIFYTSTPIDASQVEERLMKNHHYHLARRLGQLEPVRVFLIEGDATLQYFENCRRFGQRLGDIKPIHLSAQKDYHFQGHFLTV